MRKQIVICGGGSSAHVLIPFLSGSDFDVSILTSKPDAWSNEIEVQYQDVNQNVIEVYKGRLSKASNAPQDLIPEADYIILCMPVSKYRMALHEIAPYINKNKKVCIGTIYGQGGFNWMVDEIKSKYSLSDNIITFAFGLIPWICRIVEYGKVGVTYGCKAINVAAVAPHSYFDEMSKEFFDIICNKWFGKGKVVQADNFLSLTLSVDNQIIHTSRCLGLHKKYGGTWDSLDKVPMFYRDYDELSAQLLKDLDDDYSLIREKIKELYPQKNFDYMLDYLALERLSYQSANTDIRESFVTSSTLGAIKTPVVENNEGLWEIDKNHRFFVDDIFYGNCIAKWIAEQLKLNTPTIDNVLRWAQLIRDEQILGENNELLLESHDLKEPFKAGTPNLYGFSSIDDIVD